MGVSDGVCHLCKIVIEDVKHLFALFPVSKDVTRRLKNNMNNVINMYIDCSILLQSWNIITGYSHHTNKIIRMFVNFILHVLKWENPH